MQNITFDLETLGNTSNAPIVQIGAVKFLDDGTVLDEFVRYIKIECLGRYNFNVDYSTLQWWFSQDDKAIKSVMCPNNGIDLRLALREFHEWIGKPSEYRYWCHNSFDSPILKNNCIQVGLEYFLPFRQILDLRTLENLAGGKPPVIHEGVAHNAVDDCLYQVKYVSILLKQLGLIGD